MQPEERNAARKEEEFATAAHEFSIVQGGPLYDFLLRVGVVRLGLPNAFRRIIAAIVLTWVPLLILSIKDGLTVGHRVEIPFLYDFSVYTRFLVALPLFILAEVVIDPGIRHAVEEFVETRIVQEGELQQYEEILHKTQHLRDSAIPELLLFVLAFVPVFLLQRGWATATSWRLTAHGLTSAGWWFATISSPLLRFVIYRWLFRYFIWALLLWRIIHLKLHLLPTHPDHTAGLAFLRLAQGRFGMLLLPLGCMFAGQLLDRQVHEGVPLASLGYLMVEFLILALIFGLLPMLLLTPKLAWIRRIGLREYGRLGTEYTEQFDRRWVHPAEPPKKELLGADDIQSLADLNNSFAIIDDMSMAPISKRLVALLALAAAVPLIPVIIVGTPTPELVKAILKMVM